jgi:hypothetical protein
MVKECAAGCVLNPDERASDEDNLSAHFAILCWPAREIDGVPSDAN